MLTNKLKRFGQSKFIPILLTVLLLFLPLLTSCSRRSQYEDQLESQKEAASLAESLADAPQVGANGEANIIGTIVDPADWKVTIQKQGDTPYFEGKTTEELYEMYKRNGDQKNNSVVQPQQVIR